jgi:hypothetical protein
MAIWHNTAQVFCSLSLNSFRFCILCIVILLWPFDMTAQEAGDPVAAPAEAGPDGVGDYGTLREGFLARDDAARRLELTKEQAALALRRFSVDNGVTFTVSSGSTVFTFSPDGTYVSASPSAEISMPGARNTRLNVTAPLQSRGGELTRYGVDMAVTTGIISGKSEAVKAEYMERERAFLTALRNLAQRRLEAEREFCDLIKKLITDRNTMLQAQGEVVKARYDLEAKRAQGYGSSAVIVRTAELKQRSQERALREAQRILETALRDFGDDCGVERAEIPANIPEEELAAISSFSSSLYTELENAVKTYEIHTLSRKSQDHFFTLDGSAGYSWNGGSAVSGGGLMGDDISGTTGSGPAGFAVSLAEGSSVTAGAGLTAGGITVSAGISVPLGRPDEPTLTVAFQWRPSSFKVFKIDRMSRALTAAEEREAINTAKKKFRNLIAEYDQRMADLEWQRSAYEEEAELYRINAEDQRAWLDRGIIKETDYLDARTDYLLAENRSLSARIDRRLYNLELESLFVPALAPAQPNQEAGEVSRSVKER